MVAYICEIMSERWVIILKNCFPSSKSKIGAVEVGGWEKEGVKATKEEELSSMSLNKWNLFKDTDFIENITVGFYNLQ